jgi:hypothetical protein
MIKPKGTKVLEQNLATQAIGFVVLKKAQIRIQT